MSDNNLPHNIEQHPCYGINRTHPESLSHRGGGFGGTCARCGSETDIDGKTRGVLKWEPAQPPKPFQPGSIERAMWEAREPDTCTKTPLRIIQAMADAAREWFEHRSQP